MKVETLSIVCMVISMVMAIGFFLGLMLIFKFRFKMRLSAFFTGCGTMFLFAFVLEAAMHKVVLSGTRGDFITGNIWLYGLYGAAAAAVFEETGRFLAMKFVLKNQHDVANTGIMYGAGHGGFEALYILGLGMISNIALALVINSGAAEVLYSGMDEATSALITAQMQTLWDTAPFMFLVGSLERAFAITAQIAMSIIMFKGVILKNVKYIILPLILHFVLDFVAVIVNNFFGIAVTEMIVFVMAMIMILWAKKIYFEDGNLNNSED
ncbi:MAG: YhfC family intramembrane metalloprotease [Pseudobutyrivibrio sp.]|nr:YhfC family intramembrane metalloprotease [Pseudobutyrivibrio sp.]